MGVLSRAKMLMKKTKWLFSGKYFKYVQTDYSNYYKIEVQKSRFAGKSFVVTGATGEIGRAICFKLAGEGAKVFCCGRNKDKIEAVMQTAADRCDGELIPICMDITSLQSVTDAVDEMMTMTDKIDGLVNCAGQSAREKTRDLYLQEESVINDIIDINLKGTIFCCKAVLAQMVKQNSGKIVNISSVVGVGGKSRHAEYSAAKAGVIGLTKTLAIEYGKRGITVNCVSPGLVPRGDMKLAKIESLKKTNQLGEICHGKDISGAVAFLLSDEADFITGDNLIVAGGRDLGLKGD